MSSFRWICQHGYKTETSCFGIVCRTLENLLFIVYLGVLAMLFWIWIGPMLFGQTVIFGRHDFSCEDGLFTR